MAQPKVWFRFAGQKELQQNLVKIHDRFPKQVEKAMRKQAEIELRESKALVPVDTGTLRASGQVVGPERERTFIYVDITYGGAAEDYALIVHEDLEAHHPVGQAKYLEQPLMESAPYMADRLAEDINIEHLL